MRTIVGGFEVARRSPLALVPHAAIGALAALAVLSGAVPAGPASAPATGAFPAGLYFDLKQAVAVAPGWAPFAIWIGAAIAVRSAVLTATLWLAEEVRGSLVGTCKQALVLAAFGIVLLAPAAALFYMGVALRYAPFVWAAGGLGLLAAVQLARRGAALRIGPEISPAAPSLGAFLTYGYAIAALGALMWLLRDAGAWVVALVLLVSAPLHALFQLGWRAEARGDVKGPVGRAVAAVTGALLVLFGAATAFDRQRGQPAAGPDARTLDGSLLLLGGADSTTETGSLVGFDPRAIGYRVGHSTLVSYAGPGRPYRMEHTRRDLADTAQVVAEHVREVEPPVRLFGHSQAALLVDHMLRDGGALPERVAVVAGPPPTPPDLDGPTPETTGRGFVGMTVSRGFGSLLETVGLASFDVDAASAPVNLTESTAPSLEIPRLAIWALGDSVWLEGDWRRPDETNIVVLTDHVGAVKNAHAIEATRHFFEGKDIDHDHDSWRGLLVNVVQAVFAPWRP